MVDLAKQAFTTNNFDLSAEIFERTIQENGPSLELFLGLADSYARGGSLQKAFDAYIQAKRFGNLDSAKLNQLVTALVDIMRDKYILANTETKKATSDGIFDCAICLNLWRDPVTLHCGHTFCRECLEKDRESKACKKCQVPRRNVRISSLKTNILLSQTLEKWFNDDVKAINLKCKGNEMFKKRKFHEAIELYSLAFDLAPSDHTIPSNRSHAYASIEKYHEALADAEKIIQLRPDWPKAYFRKGVALSGVGRCEEAAFAYLQCLTLDPQVPSARTALAQSINDMLSPLPAEDLKRAELQSYLNPYPLSRAMQNFAPDRSFMKDATCSPAFLSKSNLLRLRSSLEGTIIQSNAQNASPFSLTATDSLPQCASSPSTPLASPRLLGKRQRTSSESNLLLSSSPEPPSSPVKSAAKVARGADVIPVLNQSDVRDVPMALREKEDFECTLCYRILFQPVTTPCGHVFCRHCLDRCLDHMTVCPLCKTSLSDYLAERRQAVTEAVVEIIQEYFPNEFTERQQQHEQDLAELARMGAGEEQEVPIFVCTLSFPKMVCPLHIFEPKYRLMVRQCMEAGTRQFGMCVRLQEGDAFSDYGCMLEIRDVQYFPDGRSVVDTVGGRRFKVLSRDVKNGYDTAKVEFLSDHLNESPEAMNSLQEIHDSVRRDAEKWIESLPSVHRLRIQQHMGPLPTVEINPLSLLDGPAWTWWLVSVLPLDPKAKLSILAMCSLKDRLLACKRVLQYVMRKSKNK